MKSFVSVLISSVIAFAILGSGIVMAETGYAVYYSDKFQGRKTANGEIFDQSKLTAAHKNLPFGTQVSVTNLENDRKIVVKVNDRMPARNSSIIEVTKRAAEELDIVKKGRARVSLEVVKDSQKTTSI